MRKRNLPRNVHLTFDGLVVKIQRKGVLHWDGYFQTVEEAEKAAHRLRTKLDKHPLL